MQSTLAGIEKGFLQNGAFICWSCASSTLVHRLQPCQVFLTPPKIPDQLLTLRRILICNPALCPTSIMSRISTPEVLFKLRIPREHHLCDPCGMYPINIGKEWWMPYLCTSVPTSTEAEAKFPIPRNYKDDRII